jgi:uncharacterized protein YndB with AHSA1/START domain
MNSNQIEKKIVLRAPQERVWCAISDSSSFGYWFGVEIDEPFVAGQEVTGKLIGTGVDPEVRALQEPYRGFPWRIVVERIDPMKLFSFRWHPGAIDPNHDYSQEPMTLVTFELSAAEEGTLLTITESGFEAIPASRRAKALEGNDSGWAHQCRLIEKYLALKTNPL